MSADIKGGFNSALKQSIQDAFYYSQEAYNALFHDEEEDEKAAFAYLQLASAKMATARALYFARYDLVESDSEDLFQKFDTFANELIENYATSHSHQWTGFEFDDFKEAFENSDFAFPESK